MKTPTNLLILKLITLTVLLNSCIKISFAQSCIDYEGNEYKTVKIGTQIWMAENLRVRYYQNDEPIIKYSERGYSSQVGYYMDESDLDIKVSNGLKYNWYAVADPRSICPVGWRLPTLEDIDALIKYFGSEAKVQSKFLELGFSDNYWTNTEESFSNKERAFVITPDGKPNPDFIWYIVMGKMKYYTFPVRCIKI